MQIAMICLECQRNPGPPSFEPLVITYYDDLVAEAICSRGHRNTFVLQDQKFEVLMESGVNALESGFTLEAVASFSAALERFHEFCMRVWYGDRQMGLDIWEPIFKPMRNQSERQLGAFMMLYALRLREVYIPDNKRAQFRNEVIHKGEIPTQEQAWTFCEAVYSEIDKLYKVL